MAVISISLMACAQKETKTSDIPDAVKAKVATLYPDVTDIDWTKENADYEAEFDVNKTETSLLIDANGNLKETEVEMDVASLPQPVRDAVNKINPGGKIKEASKITRADGTVVYEAEIKQGDLLFDANGNQVK